VQNVTSSDGTTIAFDRSGEGPPVVVVGGAFSQRRYPDLVRLAELLGERFTVINYDRRGRGDSGDTRPYAIEREVEDLGAVVGAAGGSARVLGLSSGANLALEAAASGLPIEKLALWELPYALGGRPLPPEELAKMYEGMVAAGRPGNVNEFFMGEVVGDPLEDALHRLQAPLDHVDQAPPDIIPRSLIEPAQGAVDEQHSEAVDR
jgi:pimeloyl-ACP methyl ester carboxylesterase